MSNLTQNDVKQVVSQVFQEADLPTRTDVQAMIDGAVANLPTRTDVQAMIDEATTGLLTEVKAKVMINDSATDLVQNMTEYFNRVWEQIEPMQQKSKRHTKALNEHSGQLSEHTFLLKEHDRTFMRVQTSVNKLLTDTLR